MAKGHRSQYKQTRNKENKEMRLTPIINLPVYPTARLVSYLSK